MLCFKDLGSLGDQGIEVKHIVSVLQEDDGEMSHWVRFRRQGWRQMGRNRRGACSLLLCNYSETHLCSMAGE